MASAAVSGATSSAPAVAGAGSVWNSGSWHWEEKSFTTIMHEFVKAGLLAISVDEGGINVRVSEVKEIKGEASINIRKGRKVPIFELSFKAQWQARPGGDAAPKPEEGELQVFDLFQDDVDDDFEVRVSITSPGAGFSGAATARGTLVKRVRKVVRDFAAMLPTLDGDERSLEEDKRRREAEAARAREAAEKMGAEKERLAREASEADRRRREEAKAATAAAAAAAAASAASDAASAAASSGDATAKGSVWNTNDYHWEEKSLTLWAKERLKELLFKVEIEVPNGTIRVCEVPQLFGDASTSVRKGRKLVFYELKIQCEWEGEILDNEGKVVASGDGLVEIEDFDQDDDVSDVKIVVKAANDAKKKHKYDEKLGRQMKIHGEPLIREKLRTFVTELRGK